MGNVFKIKRGNNKPELNDLEPYELGYQIGNAGGRLYIRDNNQNAIIQIGAKIHISSTAPTDYIQDGDLWIKTNT